MDRPSFRLKTLLITILFIAVAIILSPSRYEYTTAARNIAQRFRSRMSRNHLTSNITSKKKTPVYFLSHGGPNIMYDTSHPVYPQLQKIGREITEKVKPKAVVVFSAHWQGEKDVIEINTFENTELIYDFYGFPSKYYKETYPNKGSPCIAQKVIDSLIGAGIKVERLRRGLDHGVWAVFKVAFNEKTNPLNVPIIQVSLFASEDSAQHLALGHAVSRLREEGVQIIVSGMAVHNLRDMRFGFANLRPYAKSFDEALREAVETDVSNGSAERDQKMVDLLERSDARGAHPTFEHLLPIHVGAGAAGTDRGKMLWTLVEGSFSWAQYRFGDVPE